MERHPPAPLKSYPNNLSIASVLIEDDGNLDPLPVNKKRRDLKTVPVAVDGMNGQLKTKQTRGRKGKLRQLPEMPLDILFEIFGHLNPLDVLHLAQTTKSLRYILMRRSGISIWKQARSNVGLPECPSDLTEAQYANLAFNPYCHYCFAPHVQTILWACRVRCCKKCQPHEFVDKTKLSYLRFSYQIPDFSLILPCVTKHVTKRNRSWTRELFSITQAKALCAELVKVKNDKEILDQWMKDRNKVKNEQLSHAGLCESWHHELIANRSYALGDARNRRKEVIIQKLTALGWGEEVTILMHDDPASFHNHPLVKQPKDLTDRMWSNIKAAMVEFFEDVKEARLEREKMEVLTSRLKLLVSLLADYVNSRPACEITPPAADVYFMANTKTIIEKTPIDVEVNATSFTTLLAQLPRLSEEWRQSKNEKLTTLVNTYRKHTASEAGNARTLNIDLTPLDLATTYFNCSFCLEPISYPRILAHNCMTSFYPQYGHTRQRDFVSLYTRPWNHNGSSVTFHEYAHKCARWIVEVCGFDPELITAHDMDEANPMLYCRSCGLRHIMGWRKAIIHVTRSGHNGFTHPPLVLLTDDQKVIAEDEGKKQLDCCPHLWDSDFCCVRCYMRLEGKKQLDQCPYLWGSDFCCARCNVRLDWLALKNHIAKSHDVAVDDIQEIDYYFHVDATMDRPPLPVLIPVDASSYTLQQWTL